MNTKAFLVLLVFVCWTFISWQWYTCEISGFCPEDDVQTTDVVDNEAPAEEQEETPAASAEKQLAPDQEAVEDAELETEEPKIETPSEADIALARLVETTPFSITFMYNSEVTYFRQKSTSELQDLCADLNIAGSTLMITGHADNKGEYKNADALGSKRAAVMAAKLVECGCAEAMLQTTSVGSREPVAGSTSVNERARNRRVEVSILTE
jgi:outer membrane protein OmpA-like peptidoglycan-associated protein